MSRATAVLLVLVVATLAGVAPASAAPPPHAGRPDPEQATVPGEYIVVYRATESDSAGETNRLEQAHGFRASRRYGAAVRGFAARLNDQQVQRLREHPSVALVTPDRVVVMEGPVAPGELVPTGVQRVVAATAATASPASNVRVAVLDSGVDLDHPDLTVAPGVNCIGAGPPEDDNGHGTHVAGTIAANNTGAGVVGVAPGTTIVPVKVLNANGGGTWSQIICGLDWVTATRTDADPTNDVAVANMSLSGPGTGLGTCATTSDALHRAVCGATAAGVTVVAAAGNQARDFDNATTPRVPAVYPEVLTVTAVADADGAPGGLAGAPVCDGGQVDDTPATFSNYATTTTGAAHLIAAPGSCILSTWPGGLHATASGTSMAAPNVAGLVALCLDAGGVPGRCAGLTVAQIRDTMRATAGEALAVSPTYGFDGDPSRPRAGRTYGHLAWYPTEPSLAVADAELVEPASGSTGRPVTVTLSRPSTSTVTVGYTTANDTAVAPGDYTATTGTLTFLAGETTKTVVVPVTGDAVAEPAEAFSMTLSAPTNAVIGDATAELRIVDPVPTVQISNTTVTEVAGGVVANLTVSLSTAAYDPVTVSFATVNDTAVAPADFVARSGSLTFARGQRTATVSVTVNDDALDEATERLDVNIAITSGRATLADGSGVINVTDNDNPPTMSINDATIAETNVSRTVVVTVSLSAPSGRSITFARVTQDGTAVAGSDYTALVATPRRTIQPGQTTFAIAITIRGDTVREGTETFSVVLSAPNYATLADDRGTVTITNDD